MKSILTLESRNTPKYATGVQYLIVKMLCYKNRANHFKLCAIHLNFVSCQILVTSLTYDFITICAYLPTLNGPQKTIGMRILVYCICLKTFDFVINLIKIVTL